MRLQRFSNRQTVVLGAELGGGGEGKIYEVQGEPSLVAKVYHQGKNTNGEKLKVMFANPPQDPGTSQNHVSIAWTVDLLCSSNSRQIVGFLMGKASDMRPIHSFYTPKTRRQKLPGFNYFYLHRTARNLAAAIGALHARNYVIGDVNESNILVAETALITLVDTDSFQVRDPQNRKVYRCPVGKPEFTPPELQGKNFRDIDRIPEHDLFGLGVLIFQLLMEGTHPFEGIFQGTGDPPPKEKRISAGHFPYSRNVPYRPKPFAPSFNTISPSLQKLFLQCFKDGHQDPKARPDARTWVEALDDAEHKLVVCRVNRNHRYGNHLSSCPWCERTAKLKGRDPFPEQPFVNPTQIPLPSPSKAVSYSFQSSPKLVASNIPVKPQSPSALHRCLQIAATWATKVKYFYTSSKNKKIIQLTTLGVISVLTTALVVDSIATKKAEEARIREQEQQEAIKAEEERQAAIKEQKAKEAEQRQRELEAAKREEQRRRAAEEAAKKAEAERKERERQAAIQAEQERQRQAAIQAEKERQRQAAIKAEQQRKAAIEAERKRQAAIKAEQQRKAAIEAERKRQAAIKAEQQRKAAIEAEQARQRAIQAERERQRQAAIKAQKQQQLSSPPNQQNNGVRQTSNNQKPWESPAIRSNSEDLEDVIRRGR